MMSGILYENIKNLLSQGWSLNDQNHLYKEYRFSNFKKAFDFVSHIAVIAEEMDHHPLLTLEWGKVSVEIWTHVAKELTEKDTDLAYKIHAIDA